MQLDLCPKKLTATLVQRSFTSDVKSTAESFKHWDTCMDNKTCKIVAIVGFVLAGLLLLWLLSSVIMCLCMGVTCLEALCCCCCRKAHRDRYVEPAQPYMNQNMYPQQQPMRQVNRPYEPVPLHNDAYQARRYSEEKQEYTGYRPLYH